MRARGGDPPRGHVGTGNYQRGFVSCFVFSLRVRLGRVGLLSEGISVSSEGNQKNGIYNWPFLSPDLRRLAVFNASTLPDDGLGEFDLLAVWILHEIPEGRRMTPPGLVSTGPSLLVVRTPHSRLRSRDGRLGEHLLILVSLWPTVLLAPSAHQTWGLSRNVRVGSV